MGFFARLFGPHKGTGAEINHGNVTEYVHDALKAYTSEEPSSGPVTLAFCLNEMVEKGLLEVPVGFEGVAHNFQMAVGDLIFESLEENMSIFKGHSYRGYSNTVVATVMTPQGTGYSAVAFKIKGPGNGLSSTWTIVAKWSENEFKFKNILPEHCDTRTVEDIIRSL
jgi:hypothetical protein